MGEDAKLVGDGQPQIAWANADLYRSASARIFTDTMMASPKLEWVQSGATGLDSPIFGQILRNGVRLTTSHAQAPAIADYVLHGVLDRFQGAATRRAFQSGRQWRKTPFRELGGSSWLIIGFGAIGQAVAKRARAFDARVVGLRRQISPHPLADQIAGMDALATHLPDADVVVLALPISNASRDLVNADFLARMKPGSLLVNVSRGAMVDEPALLEALDRGAPAAAVLDVFATEPLPSDSPLWSHPGVDVSPHASSMGSGMTGRSDDLFLRNLESYLAGDALENEAGLADL